MYNSFVLIEGISIFFSLRQYSVDAVPIQRDRAVNRQDFTTKNLSVGAASRPTGFSWQVGWRSQLMASRIADLSQASEASQISSLTATEEALLKQEKMHPALNKYSYKHGSKTSRVVGTSGKQKTVSPTGDQLVT